MITSSVRNSAARSGLLRRFSLLPIAAAAAMTLGAWTSAPAATTYRDGACTALGQYATCVAGGNATRPFVLDVHVQVGRSQWIRVYYDAVCGKGFGAGSKSGSFRIWVARGRTAAHNVPHPYKYPDTCSVSDDAQISTGNYLHIFNTYRRW